MKIYLVIFIIFISGKLIAFEPVTSYGSLFTETMQFNTNQKKIQEIQANFIKNIFTDPLLKSMHVFDNPEDEEDQSIFNASTDYFDDILAMEIARDLAKQDLLGFEKLIQKQSR